MKYRLEDICTSMVRGPFGSALKKEFFVDKSEDTYKVYEQGNAIRKTVEYGQYHIDKDKFNELKRFEVKPFDFIMSCSGTIGELYQLPSNAEKGLINQALLKMTVNKEVVDYDFFKYIFLYNIVKLESKGSGIKNVASVKVLKEIKLEIPPLNEQKEIIIKLKNVKKIIEGRTNQLVELDLFIKSRFVEMFGDPVSNPKGWKEIIINKILNGKTSNGFFSKRDDYCDDGNVRILGVADIVNRMYSKVENLPRTNAISKDIEKYEVKYGDILFCRSSLVAVGIGKASIVPFYSPKNILFECHVIRLQLDLIKCVPEYIQMLTTTAYFRNQVKKHAKTSTMTTIGQDGILSSKILLPPIEEQKKFLEFVQQVDKLKVEVQKSLEETQLLLDSLMQKYFE